MSDGGSIAMSGAGGSVGCLSRGAGSALSLSGAPCGAVCSVSLSRVRAEGLELGRRYLSGWGRARSALSLSGCGRRGSVGAVSSAAGEDATRTQRQQVADTVFRRQDKVGAEGGSVRTRRQQGAVEQSHVDSSNAHAYKRGADNIMAIQPRPIMDLGLAERCTTI